MHIIQDKSLGKFLSIVSEFFSDTRQRVRLEGKVNASVDVVSGVPLGSVLEPLLFILYTSEFFHIARNHIVGYAPEEVMSLPSYWVTSDSKLTFVTH